MLVVGITGKNCAGKDTVADVLEQQGWGRHSLSDAIRAALRAEGKEVNREHLIAKGNALRKAGGPGVLAEEIKKLLTKEQEVVVSIRNPSEVAALRKLEQFILLGVDAPARQRWEREVARAREGGETLTFEQFQEKEAKENSDDPNSQQLDTTLSLADEIIMNDASIPLLQEKVEELCRKWMS